MGHNKRRENYSFANYIVIVSPTCQNAGKEPKKRRTVMEKVILDSLLVLSVLLMALPVLAHCEIPCGIYDDETRIKLIAEDITTIEKGINEIHKLSGDKKENYNQIVRWVKNKEDHALRIQDTVHQYFMTQRVKPPESQKGDEQEKYVEKITLLHELLIYAMKAKQTTDLENVEKMREKLEKFRTAYFGA
jgi:nickel superoxide dismutase